MRSLVPAITNHGYLSEKKLVVSDDSWLSYQSLLVLPWPALVTWAFLWDCFFIR
jgi:hypothetical protein